MTTRLQPAERSRARGGTSSSRTERRTPSGRSSRRAHRDTFRRARGAGVAQPLGRGRRGSGRLVVDEGASARSGGAKSPRRRHYRVRGDFDAGASSSSSARAGRSRRASRTTRVERAADPRQEDLRERRARHKGVDEVIHRDNLVILCRTSACARGGGSHAPHDVHREEEPRVTRDGESDPRVSRGDRVGERRDLAADLPDAKRDRLRFDVDAVARGLRDVAGLPDPVGRVESADRRGGSGSPAFACRSASSSSSTRRGRACRRKRQPSA